MQPEYRYNIELGPDEPQAPQPDKVKVQLKPHQRAALHKAWVMENIGKINYSVDDPERYINDYYGRYHTHFRGRFEIESNVGILGDIVGYGKTLTALSIIASTPVTNIYCSKKNVYSYHDRNYSYFTAVCDKVLEATDDEFINTTLAIVPRGPVFVQWLAAIRDQTNLKALVIDSVPSMRKNIPPTGTPFPELKTFFESFDVILIKATTMKSFMDHYEVPYQPHPFTAWGRIMVDEAHDIVNKIPLFSWRFLWLISGTYPCLMHRTYGSRNQLAYGIREILTQERMNLLLLKGKQNFVMQSFSVPQPQERWYLCQIPRYLAAVQPFLSANVQERINANDISGAIRELGGQNETEEEIVDLVTKEIRRDINNKEREIQYVQTLDVPEETRVSRLNTLRADLQRMQERETSLLQRVTALSEKSCPICYDTYENPIVLPCTHVVCGTCLLHWMRSGHVCPECRAPIQSQKLIAIVKQKEAESQQPQRQEVLTKEDTLIKLVSEKPDGRFLVFSRCDSTFSRLTSKLLESNISHAEIKGNTGVMMNILDRFKAGQLRVILLNTHHAGSGIDISCATDVVIFHSMGIDKTQAVGRAQRVGRREPLHIHNLCYPSEMNSDH